MMQAVLTGVVLVICSYTDIKNRKIYKSVIGAHLVLALIGHLALRDLTAVSILLGVVPGLGCILLSAVTKESMGYGDAFLIFSCGFSLGTDRVLAVMFTSFFCVGIWALWLVCFRHGKKKTAIPFVPFLLMGAVIQGLGALLL
ncbi:MAG: A24 family peptidase [Lachnospiraceae bacterium]|nr:A24 family peptidase [Lachnospiraceae bacterium]